MTNFSFHPGQNASLELEKFIDHLNTKAFINDVYNGSILMCLEEVNDVLINNAYDGICKLEYHSDSNNLTIILKVSENLFNRQQTDKTQNDNNIKWLLIESMTDNINITNERKLELVFNISAIHSEIYNKRERLLKEYFTSQKVTNINDSF